MKQHSKFYTEKQIKYLWQIKQFLKIFVGGGTSGYDFYIFYELKKND